MEEWQPVRSSFRDPDSSVHTNGHEFLRRFRDPTAWAAMERVLESGLFQSLLSDGLIPAHEVRADLSLPALVTDAIGPASLPPEWSFRMLQAAATATLEIAIRALEHGVEMKDGSAFNIVFDASSPTFVDLGSFRPEYSGHWPGYSQFHDQFVSPLVAMSYGLAPGSLAPRAEGVPLAVARSLVPMRGRGFALVHRRHLADSIAARLGSAARDTIATTRVPIDRTIRLIRRLQERLGRLRPPRPQQWTAYQRNLPYSASSLERKERFVRESLAGVRADDALLDVGANVGHFSRILASAGRVVAIDTDSPAIDVAHSLRVPRVSTMVVDITNPTPAFGWGAAEHPSWLQRMPRFRTSYWLAVVHHLALTQNIPFANVARLAAEVGETAVVEFPDASDERVRSIRVSGVPEWYTRQALEAAFVGEGFAIDAVAQLSDSRTIHRFLR